MSLFKQSFSLAVLSVWAVIGWQSAFADEINSTKCRADQWKNVSSVEGKVISGVDGDTAHILLQGKNYSVRFLSIDTPETHFNGQSQGKWGEEAAAFTQKLLPEGTPVRVEFDQEPCDPNGRVLGHIFKKDSDGKEIHVNQVLLEEALAVMYCIYPNTHYCKDFGQITEKNILEKKGIFSDPDLMIPYEWRTKMRQEPPSKYVGDLYTEVVYQPSEIKNIPVPKRIFFFKAEDVQPPFQMAH